jgi:hypothetical protein
MEVTLAGPRSGRHSERLMKTGPLVAGTAVQIAVLATTPPSPRTGDGRPSRVYG